MRYAAAKITGVILFWCPLAQAADCVSKLGVHRGATEEIISCMKEMEAENAQLKVKINSEAANSNAGIPNGAVLAFDLANGCPKGWKLFEPAASRFIIGASGDQPLVTHDQDGALLSARAYRDSGGREKHQISFEELPPLSFNFTVNSAAIAGGDRYNAGGHDYPVIVQSPVKINTNAIGSSSPLLMMPPFISLYYCKKE